jgi:hypothetical protein
MLAMINGRTEGLTISPEKWSNADAEFVDSDSFDSLHNKVARHSKMLNSMNSASS